MEASGEVHIAAAQCFSSSPYTAQGKRPASSRAASTIITTRTIPACSSPVLNAPKEQCGLACRDRTDKKSLSRGNTLITAARGTSSRRSSKFTYSSVYLNPKYHKSKKLSFQSQLPTSSFRTMTPPSSNSAIHITPAPARPQSGRTTLVQRMHLATPEQPPCSTTQQSPLFAATQRPQIGSRLPGAHQSRSQLRPPHHLPKAPANALELRISVSEIPVSWTTWDLYTFFQVYGNVSRVDMYEPRNRIATILFQPAPADMSWVGYRVIAPCSDGRSQYLITENRTVPLKRITSVNDTKKTYPERMKIPLLTVDFGVMQTPSRMQILQSSKVNAALPSELTIDVPEKAMFITFAIEQPAAPGSTVSLIQQHFKMRINFAQTEGASVIGLPDNTACLVFSVSRPPQILRKTSNVKQTHEKGATLWDERKTWFRQSDIDFNPLARNTPIQLRKDMCVIDFGRWLSYRLRFNYAVLTSPAFQDLSQALLDHNVPLWIDNDITFEYTSFGEPGGLWKGLDILADSRANSRSFLDDLHQMGKVHLPFALRYQLEVCLSLGILHECNIDRTFIEQLATIDADKAIKILEKIADAKDRYYEPNQIFHLQNGVSAVHKKRPGYCTRIRSAVITPSTIYFATPVLDTSNRVVRQFQQHEDRFLRVKFTDEKYRGKIMSCDDSSMNEVFSRVSRAMTHGITIGNRHYEFLAFGSSQFRENGAYFFSSTSGCTAEDIRHWMGNFTAIEVVAKYCARLGQCFSTTRAIPHSVNFERIPDVEKDGVNFTDGVGKISPFLACMIAHHFHLPNNSQNDCPSAFQFRLAGCKGVLAVDLALKGTTVQIRPSQMKFPADYQGLEICRIAQYQAANLNVQLILVLSTLGVPDSVFLQKLRRMMMELSTAMTNEHKACELLQKSIDFNQMTLTLASMIYDGFMESQDPFTITCLRLWRSWNLKYLKEKARIFIESGAFLMGTTDETQTLRGHFNTDKGSLTSKAPEIARLPEIFLQIPDSENKGRFKVIEEICILTRSPCLHPGDIRVVRAVDVPALHHHRNVVVLPQTGDHDLANMCSGGDLDGDDYTIIWDKDLLPQEWNHEPMAYTAPSPVKSEGPVTVKDIAKFFVNHIKHDNLSRIAVAHRYWADSVVDGVKDPRCLELAELHSKAVDYAKTGVSAEMPPHLRVRKWPHWCEPKNKARGKVYDSKKVIGKLYDEVKREAYVGAWGLSFDPRVLEKLQPTPKEESDASEIKALYDVAVRRIMAQYGIKTEFEVVTTFVLDHHQEINDYKFVETIGETMNVLREEFRDMCYAKAGTTAQDRDWNKIKRFIVAMYRVTANEVHLALAETEETTLCNGHEVPVRPLGFDSMPFMSFPWLFHRELGQIATEGKNTIRSEVSKPVSVAKDIKSKQQIDLLGDGFVLPPLPEVTFEGETLHQGDVLDLFQDEVVETPVLQAGKPDSPTGGAEKLEDEKALNPSPSSTSLDAISSGSVNTSQLMHQVTLYQEAGLPADMSTWTRHEPLAFPPPVVSFEPMNHATAASTAATTLTNPVESLAIENGEKEDSDGYCESVVLKVDEEPSSLEKLAQLIGFKEGE